MKSGMMFKEVRFCLDEEKTHCYVRIETWANNQLVLWGWHHKTFPLSSHMDEILKNLTVSASTWPVESPEDKDKKEE